MKYSKWFLLLICQIFLLSSCGTAAPTPVSEAKLQDDLRSSTVFTEAAEDLALEITDFEIIKRQTTPEEKTDKVWVALNAETNNNSGDRLFTVGAHLECVMIYGLYNEGWILDEISTEDNSWSFVPLSGFSDKDAAEIVQIEGGEFISNVVDLDAGTQYTTFRKMSSEQYCERVSLIEREWFFSAPTWNTVRDVTLDASETWHINEMFSNLDHTNERWISFDGTSLRWGAEYIASDKWKSVDNMSREQFTLSAMSISYVDEIEKGYSVEFDNVNWGDVQYAAKIGDATIVRPDILLIGYNHIYRWTSNHYVDFGSKIIHYEFEEWVPNNSSSSGNHSVEAAYIPGTYIGTGSGWDEITVSVTVDEYRITDIKIIQHTETPGTGTRAFEPLTEAILKRNSADVDAVSGSTITSKGIIAAVEDALSKAQKS